MLAIRIAAFLFATSLAFADETFEIKGCAIEFSYGTNPTKQKVVDGTLRVTIPTKKPGPWWETQEGDEKMTLATGGSSAHFAQVTFTVDGKDYSVPFKTSMKSMYLLKQLHDAHPFTRWAVQSAGSTHFRPGKFEQLKINVAHWTPSDKPFVQSAEAEYGRLVYDGPIAKGAPTQIKRETNHVSILHTQLETTRLPGQWKEFYENHPGSVFFLPVMENPFRGTGLNIENAVSLPVVRLGQSESGKAIVAVLDHWQDVKAGLRSELPLYEVEHTILEIPSSPEDVKFAMEAIEARSRNAETKIGEVDERGRKTKQLKGEDKPIVRKIAGLKINTLKKIPEKIEGDVETFLANKVADFYPAPFKFYGTDPRQIPRIGEGPAGFDCIGKSRTIFNTLARALKF